MFSASARKARLRNNPFTLRMTIWGFPAVKLHAAVLVTSTEHFIILSVLLVMFQCCLPCQNIVFMASVVQWPMVFQNSNLKPCTPFAPMVSTLHHFHTAGAHSVPTGFHLHRMTSLPAKFQQLFQN